jgi:uncharacterized membrane protein HdeD (DUF308 family)
MAGAWSTGANAAGSTTAGGRSEGRGGKTVMGVLLIIVGIFCMVVPKISGRASVMIFGLLLALSGLIELIGGARQTSGYRGMLMGGGFFALAVGVVMVARPLAGMAALTLLLAVFFLAAGLFPLMTALSTRGPGWQWEVTFGVIAIILGVFVLAGWPVSSLWLVGTLVGIEIVVRGATLLGSAYSLTPTTGTPSIRPA